MAHHRSKQDLTFIGNDIWSLPIHRCRHTGFFLIYLGVIPKLSPPSVSPLLSFTSNIFPHPLLSSLLPHSALPPHPILSSPVWEAQSQIHSAGFKLTGTLHIALLHFKYTHGLIYTHLHAQRMEKPRQGWKDVDRSAGSGWWLGSAHVTGSRYGHYRHRHTHSHACTRTHTHSAVYKASVQTQAVITGSSCQCIAEIQKKDNIK